MQRFGKASEFRISREVTDLLKRELVDALTEHIEESKRDNSFCFPAEYLLEVFLSKYVDENTDSADVRRHRAIVKWLGVEQANKRTNARLFSTDPMFHGVGYGHAILAKASRLIAKVLGPCPGSSIFLDGSFSGGASTSQKRDVGVLARKFSRRLDVTPLAWYIVKDELPKLEGWTTLEPVVLEPRLVRGNVLFTVPKTSVIDRVACKEPDLNIFGQKAVGDHIRKRLLKVAKINLNDQSINRELAREASVTGKLATIDLSSASDSLTTGLVSLLLPREWFNLLDALRCDETFIDGAFHKNEMFSSMGNGFTFELESLIFWAVAHTIRGATRTLGRVSVYGDDIIVPTGCAGALIQFLFWIGFRTNVKKTFIRGPFRESCGGHYYRGLDVTPFYLRRPLMNVSDLILFLNQFRKWLIVTSMDASGPDWTIPNRFVRLWYSLAASVQRSLRGGTDLDSRTQLVSPDKPLGELLMVNRHHPGLDAFLADGLYVSCLAALDRRDDLSPISDVSSASLRSPAGRWIIRRVKVSSYVFGLVTPLFFTEQLRDWGQGSVDPCQP